MTELSRAKRIHAVKQEGGESTDSNKVGWYDKKGPGLL